MTFTNYLSEFSKEQYAYKQLNSSNLLTMVRTEMCLDCTCCIIFWSCHNESVVKRGTQNEIVSIGIHTISLSPSLPPSFSFCKKSVVVLESKA